MSSTSELEIRSARPTDALCLSALAAQVYFDTYATSGINADIANEAKEHYSEEVFARRLSSSEVAIAVAEIGGNLVGFIDIQTNSTCPVLSVTGPEILRLYIQFPFQHQGLGQALLKYAEDRAQAQGAQAIWLTTWVLNTRAVAFYPQAGYERVGSTQYLINSKAFENDVFAKRLSLSGV
jgi:diamine N-acetyltransferase